MTVTRKTSRNWTPEERDELWRRWRKGESVSRRSPRGGFGAAIVSDPSNHPLTVRAGRRQPPDRLASHNVGPNGGPDGRVVPETSVGHPIATSTSCKPPKSDTFQPLTLALARPRGAVADSRCQ